jgi:hypothetical protein
LLKIKKNIKILKSTLSLKIFISFLKRLSLIEVSTSKTILLDTNKLELEIELLNSFLKKKRSFFKYKIFFELKKRKYDLELLKNSSTFTFFKNIFFSKKQEELNKVYLLEN